MVQYEIAQARDKHAEEMLVFSAVIGVERALYQELATAMELKYLRPLQQLGTNKLTQTISKILFDHLFSTCGDVNPYNLCKLTAKVESLFFPPQEPVDTIFSRIYDIANHSRVCQCTKHSISKE